MDLEAKLKELGDVGAGGMVRPGGPATGDNRGIPKAPARACLSGHRGTVTCVAAHPVYR